MPTLAERLQELIRNLQINQSTGSFDPEYEQGVREQTAGITRLADRYNQEASSDELERTRGMALLNESRDENLGRLRTTLADRGILRSGAALTGSQKIGKQHTRSVEDLSRSIADRARGREQDFLDSTTDFQSAIERLKVQRAQRQSQIEEERLRRESELRAKEEASRLSEEARVREERDRVLAEQQQQQELQASQPQMTPTGQYQSVSTPSGYNVPPEWMEAISANPNLAMIYGVPYRPR